MVVTGNGSALEQRILADSPGQRRSAPAPEAANPSPPERSGGASPLPAAVETLSRAADAMARDILFLIDPQPHQTIVRIMDRQTQQVIAQLPSEEAIAITRAIDGLQGSIVRQKA